MTSKNFVRFRKRASLWHALLNLIHYIIHTRYHLVGPAGFEPTTSWTPSKRSTKLSYGPQKNSSYKSSRISYAHREHYSLMRDLPWWLLSLDRARIFRTKVSRGAVQSLLSTRRGRIVMPDCMRTYRAPITIQDQHSNNRTFHKP